MEIDDEGNYRLSEYNKGQAYGESLLIEDGTQIKTIDFGDGSYYYIENEQIVGETSIKPSQDGDIETKVGKIPVDDDSILIGKFIDCDDQW